MRALPALLVLMSLGARAEDGRIDALDVTGLDRTERFVVERELPWKTGDSITQEQWDLGLARLWNTGLFANITPSVVEKDGVRRAVLEVEERFTLNPLFRFQTVGSEGLFRIGASDINLLGRFLEFGAQYERFGPYNGGQAWIKQPRLFDRRITGLLQIERLTRPRPGYADARTLARFEVSAEKHDRLAFSARVDVLSDRILSVDSIPRLEQPTDSAGVVASAAVRIGRVDDVRLRQRSWQVELRPGVGSTGDAERPRWAQITAELLAFSMPGDAWTLAFRSQIGAMSDAPIQHRFYIGGLDLVRGFKDNTIRTRQYAAANAEVRYIAFDSTWLALVPTVWVDGVIARDEAGSGFAGIASTGIGVRFLIPKMLRVGTRADIAVPLRAGLGVTTSFGVFQFF